MSIYISIYILYTYIHIIYIYIYIYIYISVYLYICICKYECVDLVGGIGDDVLTEGQEHLKEPGLCPDPSFW